MNVYVGPHWFTVCDGWLDVTYYEKGQLGAAGPCCGHEKSKRPGSEEGIKSCQPEPRPEEGRDE